jgi:preprotein translocase subunit SecD
VFGIGILLVHFALRPTAYTRAENDFTTEGKLEFWEVYADTIVYEKDVPALMETWQNSDSIVVKKEVNQSDEGNQQSSRLFALKKSTSQGPAISSAVMGGKPIIQRVEVSVSYRNADNYVPIIVHLTPDASQLWSQFTREVEGRYAALVIDGVVVLEWYIQCEINNGQFFIMHKWSSDDELDEYCKKLSRQ